MGVQSDETVYCMPSRPALQRAYGVGFTAPRFLRKDVSSLTTPTNSSKDGDRRLYVWPPTGESFPSVTTILNAISKPQLVDWAAKQAATYAVKEQQRLSKMTTEHAISEIAGTHKRITEISSEVGTHVHECIESTLNADEWKPNPWPEHMRHFEAWKSTYNPEFMYSEATVYNRQVCYAGTLDLVAQINGITTLIDVKTGKNLWPEVALQLAAYANGEFIGAHDKVNDKWCEMKMPKIEAAAVLHLRMTGWRFVTVDISDEVFKAFRHVNEVFRWTAYGSHNVLGTKGLLNQTAKEQ